MIAAVGCVSAPPPTATALDAPGMQRRDAHPVRVEWSRSDAAGVVVVGDRSVCRVPCTVWLRSDEEAFVYEEEPRAARIALPHILGLDTYDEPPTIVVTPARGRPGAAAGLVPTGLVLGGLFIPSAFSACHTPASTKGDSGGGDLFCGTVAGLGAIGFVLFVSGLIIASGSSWANAEVAPRKKPALRLTPSGVSLAF